MELLSQVYFWALFSAGIGISLWGFKRKKSKGYLLIGAFFLSPFVGLVHQEISYQIHKEELEKIREEQSQQMMDVAGSGQIPVVVEKNITLPLFECFLVFGLLMTVLTPKTEPAATGQRR